MGMVRVSLFVLVTSAVMSVGCTPGQSTGSPPTAEADGAKFLLAAEPSALVLTTFGLLGLVLRCRHRTSW